jgi:hypothetical protein
VVALALLIPAVGKGVLFTWITDVVGVAVAAAVLAFELWKGVAIRRDVATP